MFANFNVRFAQATQVGTSQAVTYCNKVLLYHFTTRSAEQLLFRSTTGGGCPLISFSNRFIYTNHNLDILKIVSYFDQGYVFQEEKGGCVAFLINNDRANKATVQFRNRSYELLPKSISILPDCQNVTFNTANVNYYLVKISYTHTPNLVNLV